MGFILHKQLVTASAVAKMARPANGAFAFVAVWLGAFVGGGELSPFVLPLLAFSAATVLILSAGNGINDIFDLPIDRINRPDRPLPSGKLSPKSAAAASSMMMVGGLVLASTAGLLPTLIAIFAGMSLVLYGMKVKFIPLAGNALVGLLTSLTFVSGGIIAGCLSDAIVPAIFAFLFTFSREIFKDIQDLPGDGIAGIRTAPLVWGTASAWRMAEVLITLGVIYSPVPYFVHNYTLLYLGIILVGVDAVLISSLLRLGRDPCPESAGRMQKILKYDILVGFAAVFLGRP